MKRVFVGCFNEAQMDRHEDMVAVQKAMRETSLEYIDTELVKKRGQITGLKIWVCDRETAFQ